MFMSRYYRFTFPENIALSGKIKFDKLTMFCKQGKIYIDDGKNFYVLSRYCMFTYLKIYSCRLAASMKNLVVAHILLVCHNAVFLLTYKMRLYRENSCCNITFSFTRKPEKHFMSK